MSELLLVSPPESEFSAYSGIISRGSLAPQKQGMVGEDFEKSLNDPTTKVTEINTEDGNRVRIPQLSRVENFSWLNSDFYHKTFPADEHKGGVFVFSEIPDVIPSLDVVNGIHELVNNDGVIVFDYPDADGGYPDRLLSFFDSVGFKPAETFQLGSQTYFNGKVSLKNTDLDPSRPFTGLNEMLGRIESQRQPVTGESAAYFSSVDEEQTATMNEFYEAAFKILNDHPTRQGLEPDEFSAVMTKDESTAKVVYIKDGEICTVCLLGDDLSKFEWVNEEFYKSRYPDEYANDQVIYFPALATNPNKQGERYGEQVIRYITKALEMGNNEIIVGFDCCDVNVGFLDIYLDTIINATPEVAIKFDVVGRQLFQAVKLVSR